MLQSFLSRFKYDVIIIYLIFFFRRRSLEKLKRMGNSISVTAEDMASSLATPAFNVDPGQTKLPPNHHPINSNASPPPECPMHQKDQPKPAPIYVSECPVKQDPKDINPLNMARFFSLFLDWELTLFFLLDAPCKSTAIPRSAL